MIKSASPKQLFDEHKPEDKKVSRKVRRAETRNCGIVDNATIIAKNDILSEAKRQAESIIGQARIEADTVVDMARQEAISVIESAREEGLQGGHDEGYKLGLEKGLEQFKQTTKHSLENLNQIIEEVIHQRDKVLKNTEKDIVDMAFAIAEKVIEAEIENDNDAVTCSVRKALGKVVSDSRIKLKIAPQDYEAIKDNIDVLAGKTGVSCAIDVVADSNVLPGGCLVDTDAGRIDVRISSQLEELRNSLKKQNDKH